MSDSRYAILFVSIVIVFGNGLVISAYLKSTGQQCLTKRIHFFLAIADCIYGIVLAITSPIYILIMALDPTEYEHIVCTINFGSILCLTAISQLCVTFANCERYFAICKQSLYHHVITDRNVKITVFFIWILPILISVVSIIQKTNKIFDDSRECELENALQSWVHFLFSFVMISFMALSLFLYIKILLKAREMYGKIAVHPSEESVESRVRNQYIRISIRRGKIIGFLTLALIVCWLPFSIISLMVGFGLKTIPASFKSTSFVLRTLSGLINPLIYAYQREDLRKTTIKMFCCCTRREVTHAIEQAETIHPQNTENHSDTTAIGDGFQRHNDIELENLELNASTRMAQGKN